MTDDGDKSVKRDVDGACSFCCLIFSKLITRRFLARVLPSPVLERLGPIEMRLRQGYTRDNLTISDTAFEFDFGLIFVLLGGVRRHTIPFDAVEAIWEISPSEQQNTIRASEGYSIYVFESSGKPGWRPVRGFMVRYRSDDEPGWASFLMISGFEDAKQIIEQRFGPLERRAVDFVNPLLHAHLGTEDYRTSYFIRMLKGLALMVTVLLVLLVGSSSFPSWLFFFYAVMVFWSIGIVINLLFTFRYLYSFLPGVDEENLRQGLKLQ